MTATNRNCCGEPLGQEEPRTMDLDERIRTVAFQRLLQTRRPVSIAALSGELDEPPERIDAAVATLDRQGRIRRNQTGDVIGSAGLSVDPSRHALFIGQHQFWTWCAYDAVGILAALAASGRVLTKSPLTGATIDLRFRDGSPEESDAALFMPDDIVAGSDGAPLQERELSPYDDWCPLANLFENREASLAWAERHRVGGQTLSLAEAAARGATQWQPMITSEVYGDP